MRTFFVALLLALCGTVRAETVYFIHVDHLNTPRLAVSEDGPVHWRWEQIEPFGDNPPIELMGPEGYLVNLPLRFPGQYADKETNLHYNYYRDYDSGIGRYVESDPIGLWGGLNTYAYVAGQPLSSSDPSGLVGPAAIAAPVVIACGPVCWTTLAVVGGLVLIVKSCSDETSAPPPVNPDREKKCKEAFKHCLGSKIAEAKCFEAYNSCIKTTEPMIFPGYGVVK